MCYYVTAILPRDVSLASLGPIATQFGRQLTPLTGPGLGAYLAPGEQYVLTTAGPCDCDTALGHQGRASRRGEGPQDDAARRLAAKGWSNARIARSLAQREKAQARHTAKADTDLARWEGFLRAVLDTGVAYVGLVLHCYEGPVAAGVALTGRQIVPVCRETPPLRAALASLREDCRYDFRAHRDRAVAAAACSPALHVISRTTAMQYKGSTQALRDVGAALGGGGRSPAAYGVWGSSCASPRSWWMCAPMRRGGREVQRHPRRRVRRAGAGVARHRGCAGRGALATGERPTGRTSVAGCASVRVRPRTHRVCRARGTGAHRRGPRLRAGARPAGLPG